jgi:Arc/MetJ family transcription regulator
MPRRSHASTNLIARVWHACHTPPMKMTMHIDEAVLAEVMELTGASSKTEAVRVALETMARRARFARMAKVGLGMTSAEILDAFEDPFPEETARVAESSHAPKKAAKYVGKRRR